MSEYQADTLRAACHLAGLLKQQAECPNFALLHLLLQQELSSPPPLLVLALEPGILRYLDTLFSLVPSESLWIHIGSYFIFLRYSLQFSYSQVELLRS